MDEVKSLLSSRTFWGAAIAVAAGVAGVLGYTVTAEDAQSLPELVTSIASSVGGLIAIFGRVMASKKIG